MSKAEIKAHHLFDSMNLASIDDEVRRHLMILLLTMPDKTLGQTNTAQNKRKQALDRLSGCISLPDDFDYKTTIAESLAAKYM